jgi:hypothetical protein
VRARLSLSLSVSLSLSLAEAFRDRHVDTGTISPTLN